MASITKYAPINGGTLISDLKSQLSILRTRRSVVVAYAVIFLFIAFTIFLAFTPSSNSSSPWFTNIFTSSSVYRSHPSSIYSYFFPNSSSPSSSGSLNNTTALLPPNSSSINRTTDEDLKKPNNANNATTILPQNPSSSLNHTVINNNNNSNNSSIPPSEFQDNANQSVNSPPKSGIGIGIGEEGVAVTNLTSSLLKKQSQKQNNTAAAKQGETGIVDDGVMKSLLNCDVFDGNWVKDESYPLYKPGSCSVVDHQFNCFLNGRPDNAYHKFKWKPKACTLPRLDGAHMLELLRGKRLVFVGDSLNRNMWESLVCILKNSVRDKRKVYEELGRHHFRSEPSYSFVFQDYNCTVEFFVSPFLVQEWAVARKNGTKIETLRLDLVSRSADKYKTADIIVFNTGHWWTHEKTSTGKDYYQEGSHVYSDLNVLEAFRKALTTWGRWIDANVNPMKSLLFFRGYSASHFSGGQWNSGGQCDHESEPIKNETYLTSYPPKMTVLENVLKGMKTKVTYLNVTRMTDYRKDGHPSIYRKLHPSDLSIQDCSHWCLPGVPDVWNEILYAELLVKLNKKQKKQR